jgi:DNA-binding response OmpR family regulator
MKRTILLADHDESVRKMLARVLESAGYVALQAGSGPEIRAQLRAAKPELVLLDADTTSQWADLTELRQAQPALPIILMTDWRTGRDQTPARGISVRIPKPLDLRVLLERIEELLGSAQETRAPA